MGLASGALTVSAALLAATALSVPGFDEQVTLYVDYPYELANAAKTADR